MSLFYQIAYRLGFTPWEMAATHPPAAKQIAALFDREERERRPPYGRALDLGCGRGHWSIELARRGWNVTGIDLVPRATTEARARADKAGVKVTFVDGDLLALREAGVGDRYYYGALHGLPQDKRKAIGREVTAIASPNATILLLAWSPRRRAPLPRGASRKDIEEIFPAWQLVDVEAFDASGLPRLLRNVDPRFYRLRRDSDSQVSKITHERRDDRSNQDRKNAFGMSTITSGARLADLRPLV